MRPAYDYETAHPALYDQLKSSAKENRLNPTEAELVLWEHIRRRQIGVPFRRQHIVGDYIVDFFCMPLRLIIEVDGGYHDTSEQQEYDEYRQKWLEKNNYQVIRFTNDEVLNDIANVLKSIKNKIINIQDGNCQYIK